MRTKICISILAGGLFLAAAIAAAGVNPPGIRVIDSLKAAYGPVTFDHEKHVQIAGRCASCHHEHSAGDGLPCKECHALSPDTFKKSVAHSFMPCKNCHGSADIDNPRMPALKTAYHRQCFNCHRGMGGIGSDPKGCTELCHSRNK